MKRPSSIPPELFVVATSRHHNFLAAAAFAVSFVSAGVHAVAFYMTRDLSRYRTAMPPHMVEGGTGFSLAAPVWLVTFAAIGVGVVGCAFLVASCLTHRDSLLSFLHIAAFIFLLPTAYTAFCIATLFFQ
jgi:hypothetical protein